MKIFLIDGNSYIYRAFYAIKGLTNSRGEPTNAAFGFTNMLMKIIREHSPEGILIALDSPEPTKRHDAYEQYKAQRPETPEDLILQIPTIKKIIKAMNIPVVEAPGYEADDILATTARQLSSDPDNEIYIISADKDMLQVVSDRISIYDPMKDIIIDPAYVLDRYRLPPVRIPELMALMGDTADNIPGVKGIGEKTASAILQNVKDLSELIEDPSLAGKERLTKMIRENIDLIEISHELAKLIFDAPVQIDQALCRTQEPDWAGLLELFRKLEFTSLLRFIPEQSSRPVSFETVTDTNRLRDILANAEKSISLSVESSSFHPMYGTVTGIAFSIAPDQGFYVPLHHTGITEVPQPDEQEVISCLKPVLEDETVEKTGHNMKSSVISLRKLGIELKGKLFDTMIASYLLNPNKGNHSIEETVLTHIGIKKPGLSEIAGKAKDLASLDIETACQYAAGNAVYATALRPVLFPKLESEGMADLYTTIEVPLMLAVAETESKGVLIDSGTLAQYSRELKKELDIMQKKIYGLAGREFNINSPKQLSEVLFHEIGLTPVKKTKTGFSTDNSVLEELSSVHPLPAEILGYRSFAKLKNTYIDTLPTLINPVTGRVHTTFNLTATATGRLSSSDPNLQNIPIRGEWGKRIRNTFIAEKGSVLISADYSQIELRILAHLSNDSRLVGSFMEDHDIHAATAAEIFSVAQDEVTPEMRRIAKSVNFGIIYGITPFGLSETLKCSPEEARLYIERYFKAHPGVEKFVEDTLRSARETGHTTTLFGRKRPISEINSKNRIQRSQAERMAMNSPVQGTAADIIKLAMIETKKRFTMEKISATIILQVHDELVAECKEDHMSIACSQVRDAMEDAAQLIVPLKVDLSTGRTWAEAHS